MRTGAEESENYRKDDANFFQVEFVVQGIGLNALDFFFFRIKKGKEIRFNIIRKEGKGSKFLFFLTFNPLVRSLLRIY